MKPGRRAVAAGWLMCAVAGAFAVPVAALTQGGPGAAPSALGAGAEKVLPASGKVAKVLVIAHRGDSAVAPENTVPAMTAAARAGADLVEFDVQRTADGQPIVVHDTTFARTTDVAQVFPGRENDPVGSFTLAEVQQLDAGSWMSAQYAGTKVPTLDQLLAAVQPTHTGVLLELKNPTLYPGYEAQVVQALGRHGFLTGHRAYVHSFDAASLARFHALAPAVPLGLITDTTTGPAPASTRSWLGTVNPSTSTVSDAAVDGDQAQHLKVFTWPPSTQSARASQVERLVDDGVDGIITNNPAATRAQITEALESTA